MTRVLQRSIAHSYPVAVRGEGIHIWDATGKQYIDASGGAAVSCLGHGHPDVLAAMHAQLDKLAYAHTSFFTTQVAEELADDLVAHAPAGHQPRLLRQRRLGGDRGGAQDGAAVFRRDAVSPSAGISSRAARAITATRWARWRSAATNGAASSSRRC